MKRSIKYQISTLVLLGLILISYNQCISPFIIKDKSSKNLSQLTPAINPNQSLPPGSSSNIGGSTRAISIQAFGSTVYKVTTEHCITCHGTVQTPLHASIDKNIAYDSIINSAKVDFSNTANSRLYLKIKDEAHYCWGSCIQNANEMLIAINNWKSGMSGTSADMTNTTISGISTKDTFAIEDALDPNSSVANGTLTIMAESASNKAPMVIGNENGTSFVWTPLNAGNKNLTNSDAGTANLNFAPLTSDLYKVYMLVSAPSSTNDSIYVKFNSNNYIEWQIDQTSGFQWKELTNTINKLETSFNLSMNKVYQMELRQKEPGVKISKVVVTNDLTFDPSIMKTNGLKATLKTSVTDLTGVANSILEIDVEPFDQYSFKLSNPRIISTKNIHVKKMKVLVNDVYNPQNATYTSIDKIITPKDYFLSAYTMILLKNVGTEKHRLSFSFELIEAVK